MTHSSVPFWTSSRRLLAHSASSIALAATTLASTVGSTGKQNFPSSGWIYKCSRAQKVRDEWSSVVGWISIACWVIVYTPQLKENYDRKSGDGLSIAFVTIWLAGDALNFAGAWKQELLGTMIILAGYYTLCDVALIFQYYYYRKWHSYYHFSATAHSTTVRAPAPSSSLQPTETTPLVPQVKSTRNESRYGLRRDLLKYLVAAGLVITTGVAAWAVQLYCESIDSKNGGRTEKPEGPGWKWDAQVYGWLSAILYLLSRIPQIFKNRQTRCKGLSLALFLFAIAGNVTYVASILIKSMHREYLIECSSWLVGSLGTVFLDFIVLSQFVAYRDERKAMALQPEREALNSASTAA